METSTHHGLQGALSASEARPTSVTPPCHAHHRLPHPQILRPLLGGTAQDAPSRGSYADTSAAKARTSQFLLLLLLLGVFGPHIFFLSRSPLRTSHVSTTAPSERYTVARRLKIWPSHVAPLACSDEVAEWLRRWTANPLCSARVGSNPILVVCSYKGLHSVLYFRNKGLCHDKISSHTPLQFLPLCSSLPRSSFSSSAKNYPCGSCALELTWPSSEGVIASCRRRGLVG